MAPRLTCRMSRVTRERASPLAIRILLQSARSYRHPSLLRFAHLRIPLPRIWQLRYNLLCDCQRRSQAAPRQTLRQRKAHENEARYRAHRHRAERHQHCDDDLTRGHDHHQRKMDTAVVTALYLETWIVSGRGRELDSWNCDSGKRPTHNLHSHSRTLRSRRRLRQNMIGC